MPIVKVNSKNRMTTARVKTPFKLILISAISLWCSTVVVAQRATPVAPPPLPRPTDGQAKTPDERPLTTFEEEIKAKRAIKLAEKDHEENLDRAREIEQLGKEFDEASKKKLTIDRAFMKKIERLEKLTKKVRGEAGGEDEEVNIVDRPADVTTAVAKIAESSATLSKDVLNTPRQVVSASVIGNANVLLELIKLFRTMVRQP